jgi:hypothetical protein
VVFWYVCGGAGTARGECCLLFCSTASLAMSQPPASAVQHCHLAKGKRRIGLALPTPPTCGPPPPLARAAYQPTLTSAVSLTLPRPLSPPRRTALVRHPHPIKACVPARLACLLLDRPARLPFPCASSTVVKRAAPISISISISINLDLRPSTPPSALHTTAPAHPRHPRLPPPPCRGSSPRVRPRQCRPDLPTPGGLSPISTP